MSEITEHKTANELIDELESAMLDYEPIDCPVRHRFTDGMYIREIFMPKGEEGKTNVVTSLVHNTTHPFVVLKGKVEVYSENDGPQMIEAPYYGITRPGTRRVLLIHSDTVWITFHPTDIKPENDSDEAIKEAARLVGLQILQPYENKLFGGHFEQNEFIESRISELLTH